MKVKELPLKHDDVIYDAASRRVTLKPEKFDQLIQYIQELLERAQSAENARDTARSRQRRAQMEADVANAYTQILEEANRSVRAWLDANTIQELARRANIPYSSCHRIVRERLQSGEIDVNTLGKILDVVQEDQQEMMPPRETAERGE